MHWKIKILIIIITIGFTSRSEVKAQAIYKSNAFSIFADKVVQGNFTAKAISSTELNSNYRSQEADKYSPTMQFKFSINCRDNEMLAGKDHKITLQPIVGECITEIKFGHQCVSLQPALEHQNLPENTHWTIKLDMREVFEAFRNKGYFTFYNGERLNKDDFKGVYVAGNKAPLSWDFSNLYGKEGAQLLDNDGDGVFETTFILNKQKDKKELATLRSLKKETSAYPIYKSDLPLSDAIYNMAIEEMIQAIEPDSTFRTGKEWAGVWTRDISYSIILSMAYLQPQAAKYSLLKKVKNNRIIQDTGTGGAYPVSTDRMIWAVAAWELYKVTGDTDWLKQSFIIIKNSIQDDLKNAYDNHTGMVRGESSFLDWREQTYPRWMQPADIYESECLGTNAVHYQANIVLSEMAELLQDKETARKHRGIAQKIKKGINQYLWLDNKGYYAQYMYGRNYKSVSPRSEALGEALCVLFGVSNKKQSEIIIRKTPQTDFGIPCIYPQIPGIPPYHNNAIWPFVQSYWALASAESGNEQSVLQSIAAIYRPSALFLTNKENFVAETGDFAGTQINSDNMLWSLSGNLALVHKVLFGIEFEVDKIRFHPFVPQTLAGNRTLSNFKYRNALLNIQMEGYGNGIKCFELDGKVLKKFEISAVLSGKHTVKITLNGLHSTNKTEQVSNAFSPETPVIILENGQLKWNTIEGTSTYQVYRNGKKTAQVLTNSWNIVQAGEYQVAAVNNAGIASFLSEPVLFDSNIEEYFVKEFVENKIGTNSVQPNGFIEISKTQNSQINIPIQINKAGRYSISMCYVNGNGPVNTENKCALRSVYIDKKRTGIFVFPQRGKDEWSNIGFTNPIVLPLKKGEHIVSIRFEPENENMNGEINQAFIQKLIIQAF